MRNWDSRSKNTQKDTKQVDLKYDKISGILHVRMLKISLGEVKMYSLVEFFLG